MSLVADPTGMDTVIEPVAETELRQALTEVASHDQRAFSRFYERVRPQVYGLARNVLGNHHLAEDTTQEVLSEVWTSAAYHYQPQRGRVMPWLLTITRRRAVDRVRAVQAARARERTYTRLQHRLLPGPRRGPEEQTERNLSAACLRQAMDQLPAHQREPLLLAYYGGHSHSQIARLLGLPLGTTKDRLYAGLRMLRALLANR